LTLGLTTAQRVEPWLDKVFTGDKTGWEYITLEDIQGLQSALAPDAVRFAPFGALGDQSQKAIAATVLGRPDQAHVRGAYKRRQLTVHPDRTANLPPAVRA